MRFLRGGDDVTGATLSRFYALHIAILPAVTTLLVGVHLLFVQRQGMSVPISARAAAEARGTPEADAVLPRLHPPRCAAVVRRDRPARRAGGVLTLGARTQGRRVRARAGRDSARVVFPGDVPHAEAPAQPHSRHRGRSRRGRRVRSRGCSASCSCRFSIGAPPETSRAACSRCSASAGSCTSSRSRSSDTWLPDMRRHSARNRDADDGAAHRRSTCSAPRAPRRRRQSTAA